MPATIERGDAAGQDSAGVSTDRGAAPARTVTGNQQTLSLPFNVRFKSSKRAIPTLRYQLSEFGDVSNRRWIELEQALAT